MSGLVKDNVFGSSGTVAAAAGGLSWDTAVVTGSTVTVEAANGYFINTTSNACTITLPSSAEAGDQIILIDYARTWGDNAITIDSNGLNFQGDPDTYTVDYDTAGQAINLVYADSTNGWIPTSDIANAFDHDPPPTQKAIFAFGTSGDGGSVAGRISLSNLVNSSGVVASDVTGVGTARYVLEAAGYGTDKAIFAFGHTTGKVSLSNLVSNSGVVASDTTGVGTARSSLAAATYGTDKAIFAYGLTSGNVSLSNLVSSSGVVASDVSGVGTARRFLSATGYGTGKAIFAYGYDGSNHVSMSNLVNTSGVIGSDVTGVGTAREQPGSARYGSSGQAIFAYGSDSDDPYVLSMSNLVTSSGVIGSDVSGVGTARGNISASSYGGDKAIFAYGGNPAVSISNLVNSSGVVGSDVSGVGTDRYYASSAGFSLSS